MRSARMFGVFLGGIVGAITGLLRNVALGRRDLRVFVAMAVTVAVALAGALDLSSGSTPDVWATEHVVIAAMLGLAFGAATSPAMRRILRRERALSSAG